MPKLLLLLLPVSSPAVEPPPNVGTLDNATSPSADANNTAAASPPTTDTTASNGTAAVVPDTTTPSPSPDTTNAAASGPNAGSDAANIGEQPAADNTAGVDAAGGLNAAGDGVTNVAAPSVVPPPVDAPIAAPPSPGVGRKMLQGNPGIGFALPSAFQGLPFGTTTTNPDGTITTGGFGHCYVLYSHALRV
jgi:hypothetical protein